MKRQIFITMVCLMATVMQAQTDSIRIESLPEIVVNADGQIETAEKTVLLPTMIEKKHSANGFDLLSVMQTAELDVSPRSRSITTHSGKEVVLCINGVEVLPEDVATLRSKNIQVVRNISTPKPQLPTTEQTTIEPFTSLPADTVKTDTIPTEPYVFNNVPLDSMLTAIAVAHNMQVEFENEAARHLRFHFVWKREDSLSRVVEKLNTFEAVNIGMEDKTLVVK